MEEASARAKQCMMVTLWCCFLKGNMMTPKLQTLLAGAVKRDPIVVGKPEEFMLANIAETFKLERHQICMVGDRLDTDILFGQDGGLTTMLVLSGNVPTQALLDPMTILLEYTARTSVSKIFLRARQVDLNALNAIRTPSVRPFIGHPWKWLLACNLHRLLWSLLGLCFEHRVSVKNLQAVIQLWQELTWLALMKGKSCRLSAQEVQYQVGKSFYTSILA